MNEERQFVKWDPCYGFGIPIIDNQHMQIVELINNLHTAWMGSSETANCSFIYSARELVSYIRYHFSTEEKLMNLLDYPELAQHKKRHADFFREILKLANCFNEGQLHVQNRFVYFIKEWIQSHITRGDKALAVYVEEMRQRRNPQFTLEEGPLDYPYSGGEAAIQAFGLS